MGKARYRIVVIEDRCKGCGICIEFCPRKVLEWSDNLSPRGYRYPIPRNADRCVGCRLCEIYCPDFAIYVEEVDEA